MMALPKKGDLVCPTEPLEVERDPLGGVFSPARPHETRVRHSGGYELKRHYGVLSPETTGIALGPVGQIEDLVAVWANDTLYAIWHQHLRVLSHVEDS